MPVESPSPVYSDQSTPVADQSLRVLIVDDQLQVAEFLAEMLQIVGYESVAESNPHRAIQRLEDEDFDVVISDFKMPEMSGIDFFHAAVEMRPALASRFI